MADSITTCPDCAEDVPAGAKKCPSCGASMRRSAHSDHGGDATGGLIPYKNVPALVGYYVSILGMLPCFPLGIAAFVLGIMGLRKAKQNPEVRGQVHAWIAIVLGGLFGLLWTVVTLGGVGAALFLKPR